MWRVDISRYYHTHSFYRLARALRTQPRFDYSPPEDGGGAPYWAKPAGLATPRQVLPIVTCAEPGRLMGSITS